MLSTVPSQKKRAAARHLGRSAGFISVEAPRSLAVMIGVVFLAVVVAAGVTGFWIAGRGNSDNTAGDGPANILSEKVARNYDAKAGPWGEIFCQRSVIEVPEEYLGLRAWEAEPVQWFFKGYSGAALRKFLSSLELSAAAAQDLSDTNKWRPTAEGVFVLPALDTVLSLSAATRNQLYLELGQFEENAMQSQPFHWPLASETDLFTSTRVAPESIATFRKLSYTRGKFLLFSDWKALLSALPDDLERNGMAQALMGRYVVFASVRVTPQTDLEALIRYWGAGGYSKDIRPNLEAAARIPQGVNVSLANLLPPHIRARINTFPFAASDEQLNCHWTAFNFFREKPDPPAGVRFWKNKLQSDYEKITGPPRYGDILLLLKPDNSLIHSCVYLADNIFYTKNGGSPFAPWQLTTLIDLLDFYSWDVPENAALKTAWYRRRS